MEFLRQYATGTGSDIIIPIVKAGSNDFATSGDWTPAAGDVKVSKDGGAAANIGTLPTFITDIGWKFVFSNSELTAARLNVNVVDSATKAIEDQHIAIATFGNASAQFAVNFADAVRFGLSCLPNAVINAAGGMYTRGTGAGQINQDANGRIDVNLEAIDTSAVAAATLAAMWGNLPTFTIASGGSSTELRTDRTEADNYWTDAGGGAVLYIIPTTPSAAPFFRSVSAYAMSNGAFTVDTMPVTPTAGSGIILGRIE